MKNQNALRGGSYSLLLSAVVLAILIVVNLFASALPTALTKYDISASKLYSITSNTKVVVNALERDVTIYWVVQSGEEDQVIENLLGKYESQKEEISLTVCLDNESYPQVSIALYRYDGAYCLAVVDGQPVSLVARTAVVSLIEAVHAIVLS